MNIFDIIIIILSIIGSLGVFLFGMILMSESLQKVAGRRMRHILSTITSNNLRGVIAGLSITGLIQSSSASTVMVVSFVNAGLINLRRSFSLIMGANIGTTVTAWIIVLLGFGKSFNISMIILPLVALSLPLLFSGRSKHRSWAELIFGFALLFLGLQFLKTSIPVVDEHSIFVQQFSQLIHYGFFSVLLFVGIGILLTITFQSSSAVMALTFVIALDGWIPFDMAAAMVLGENIGTTITANIAALVANRAAKRSAFFHFFFNLIGVIWALIVFRFFIHGIDWVLIRTTGSSPESNAAMIPLALAIFHTGFNVLNTIFFIGMLPFVESMILKIIPEGRKKESEKFYLKYLGSAYLSTSEISLLQAKKEISIMTQLIKKMLIMVPRLLMERDPKSYQKLYKKIRKYERISDKIEVEIYTYLTKISESKLSDDSSREVRKMLKIIDEIESMGDCCRNMANSIYKKNKTGIYFTQGIRDHLNSMFSLVEEAVDIMSANLEAKQENIMLDKARQIEDEINNLRDRIRTGHNDKIRKEKYNLQAGLIFNDLIVQCEKIGDHAIKISETLSDQGA